MEQLSEFTSAIVFGTQSANQLSRGLPIAIYGSFSACAVFMVPFRNVNSCPRPLSRFVVRDICVVNPQRLLVIHLKIRRIVPHGCISCFVPLNKTNDSDLDFNNPFELASFDFLQGNRDPPRILLRARRDGSFSRISCAFQFRIVSSWNFKSCYLEFAVIDDPKKHQILPLVKLE